MPKVKIDTPNVSIELEAGEVSVVELGKQAMDMFKEATEVNRKQPAGLAYGFNQDKRWTPPHQDIPGGYGRSGGFEPVHSGGEGGP